ncbi:unnamed protein product [Arctogadus glacialis]
MKHKEGNLSARGCRMILTRSDSSSVFVSSRLDVLAPASSYVLKMLPSVEYLLQLVCLILLPCGYVGVMQLMCLIYVTSSTRASSSCMVSLSQGDTGKENGFLTH